MEFYSIADSIINNVILPNISEEGKWKSDNSQNISENLRYSTLHGTEAMVWNRPQKFYSIYRGVKYDEFKQIYRGE
jgi:(p)ppGpp synthase/HD superfamily hydrolase